MIEIVLRMERLTSYETDGKMISRGSKDEEKECNGNLINEKFTSFILR